jgi:hypothetical protein
VTAKPVHGSKESRLSVWLARLAVTNKDRSFWFNHLQMILGLSSRARHRGIFVPFNPGIIMHGIRESTWLQARAHRERPSPQGWTICFPPARLSLWRPPANVNFIEPEYPRSESTIEEGTSA